MRILAISGSLRAASLNSMALRVAARVAPPGVELELYRQIGALPLFNPDLEREDPSPVAQLRARIIACDALIIASPEYAHGVSGVIKNTLDWMVGNESFVDKPVALFNTSPRASHAQIALRETLRTMSARIVDDACIELPLLGSGLSEEGVMANASLTASIAVALRALVSAADGSAGSGP